MNDEQLLKYIETLQICMEELGRDFYKLRDEIEAIKARNQRQQLDIWKSIGDLHKELNEEEE